MRVLRLRVLELPSSTWSPQVCGFVPVAIAQITPDRLLYAAFREFDRRRRLAGAEMTRGPALHGGSLDGSVAAACESWKDARVTRCVVEATCARRFIGMLAAASVFIGCHMVPLDVAAPPVANLESPRPPASPSSKPGGSIFTERARMCGCHRPKPIIDYSPEYWTQSIMPRMSKKAKLSDVEEQYVMAYILTAHEAIPRRKPTRHPRPSHDKGISPIYVAIAGPIIGLIPFFRRCHRRSWTELSGTAECVVC